MIFKKHNEFVVFDIGERYIKAILIRTNWDGSIEYVYSTRNTSKGITLDSILNLRSLSDSLFQIIYRIEIDVGTVIKSVIVIFSCIELKLKKFDTSLNIEGVVKDTHIQNIEYRLNTGLDKAILGYLYKNYKIDNLANIENPLHMCGSKISLNSVFLTVENTLIRNFITAFNRNDIAVNYIGCGNLIASNFFSDDSFSTIDIGFNNSRILVKSKSFNVNDMFTIPIGFKHLIDLIKKQKNDNLEKCEKYIDIIYDEKNKVFVDISRKFFKNLFSIICNKINEYEYFNRGVYNNYLIGGITTVPLIDMFLSQCFDKNFIIPDLNQKFSSMYNKNIFLNIIAASDYIINSKDNLNYFLKIT